MFSRRISNGSVMMRYPQMKNKLKSRVWPRLTWDLLPQVIISKRMINRWKKRRVSETIQLKNRIKKHQILSVDLREKKLLMMTAVVMTPKMKEVKLRKYWIPEYQLGLRRLNMVMLQITKRPEKLTH